MKNSVTVKPVHKNTASSFGNVYRTIRAASLEYSKLDAFMMAAPDADTRTQLIIKKGAVLKNVESTIEDFIVSEYGLPKDITAKVYAKACEGRIPSNGFYGVLTRVERLSEATIRSYIADEYGLPESVAAIVYDRAFLSDHSDDNILAAAKRIAALAGEIVKATKQSLVMY